MRRGGVILTLLSLIVLLSVRCDEVQEPLPEGGILWVYPSKSNKIIAFKIFDGGKLDSYGVNLSYGNVDEFSIDRRNGIIWVSDYYYRDTSSGVLYKFNRFGEELGILRIEKKGVFCPIHWVGSRESDKGCWVTYTHPNDGSFIGIVTEDLELVNYKENTRGVLASDKIRDELWLSDTSILIKIDSNLEEVGRIDLEDYIYYADVDDLTGSVWVLTISENDKFRVLKVDRNASSIIINLGNPIYHGDYDCEWIYIEADENTGGVYVACSYKSSETGQTVTWIYKYGNDGKVEDMMELLPGEEPKHCMFMEGSYSNGDIFISGELGPDCCIWKIDGDLSSVEYNIYLGQAYSVIFAYMEVDCGEP